MIEAKVKPCADVIKTFPLIAEGLKTDSPGRWPRIRCVISSRDKNRPARRDFVRICSWYNQNLREVYYGLDKRHSAAAATLAIPFLLDCVNNLKEPQLAEQEFVAMVCDPELIRILVETAGNATEETLRRLFKQTSPQSDGRGGGFRS